MNRNSIRFVFGTCACCLALACNDQGSSGGAKPPGSAAQGSAAATSSIAASVSSKPPAPSKRVSPLQAKVAEGRELYGRYCALCHGKNGEGYVADNAPSLISQSFLETASDAFIGRAISVGRPNTAMAGYAKNRGGPMSAQEIRKLVAYIRSLGASFHMPKPWTLKGDPKRGEVLFERECKKCHGDKNTKGNAVSLHNPEFLASATSAFLAHAIQNGRPPTPMPAFADKLKGSDIADVISWLKTFAPASNLPTPVKHKEVPKDLPLVINPKGKAPSFNLRLKRFVSAKQVKQALDQKRRLVIIDARSPSDWIQFHIPGAVPIAYYDTDQLSKIPKDGTFVVAYCACPHHASGQVIDALRSRGYKHTAVLDEGILVWKSQGYPVVGEAVHPTAASSAQHSSRPVSAKPTVPHKP